MTEDPLSTRRDASPPDWREPAAAPDFAVIYRENLGFVVAVVRRAGIPEEALREVCQEVFVRVYQTLDRYDPARPIRAWLHGVAFNVAREARRAHRKSSRGESLDEDFPSQGPDPERAALVGEALSVVERALAAMDADRRTVFEMRHLLGMTIPEIASALGGVSVDTLYARLYAAEGLVDAAMKRHEARR
jgi:RNA polymerase sigma factor (sigma-70 family)